jgi:hypothetical protein
MWDPRQDLCKESAARSCVRLAAEEAARSLLRLAEAGAHVRLFAKDGPRTESTFVRSDLAWMHAVNRAWCWPTIG